MQEEPVVVPKKAADKKEISSPEIQATLPIELVRNRVVMLKAGEQSYIAVETMRVDNNRRCWLLPNGLTGDKNSERSLLVRRDSSGYHVVIDKLTYQWETVEKEDNDWISVKSVTVK